MELYMAIWLNIPLGKLVLAASEKKVLGGSIKFLFCCNGFWIEEISYISSQLAVESRHRLVS